MDLPGQTPNTISQGKGEKLLTVAVQYAKVHGLYDVKISKFKEFVTEHQLAARYGVTPMEADADQKALEVIRASLKTANADARRRANAERNAQKETPR